MFDVVPVKVVRAQRPVSRRLMRASMGYSKPPPLKATHRWTGVPHASTSEKVVDGEVVATNLVSAPSFEGSLIGGTPNATEYREFSSISRFGSRSLRIFGATQAASRYEATIDLSIGTYTVSLYSRRNTDDEGLSSSGSWGHVSRVDDNSVLAAHKSSGVFHIEQPVGEWVRTHLTFTVDTPGEIRFRWYVGQYDISIDGFMLTRGEELLPYFDGSTPLMPFGATYRWTGTPHASTSEKVVDGEVVAINTAGSLESHYQSSANVSSDRTLPGEANSWLMRSSTAEAFGVVRQVNEVRPAAQEGQVWRGKVTIQNLADGPREYELEVVGRLGTVPGGVEIGARSGDQVSQTKSLAAGEIAEFDVTTPPMSNNASVVGFWIFREVSAESASLDEALIGNLWLGLEGEEPFDGDTPDDRANDLWVDSATGRIYMRDNINYEWVLVPQGFSAHEWMDYGTEEYAVKPVTTKGTP